MKKLTVRNPKQLNLIVLKKELLKSVDNLNKASAENLNSVSGNASLTHVLNKTS